ncbi:ATP-binding cassette domain-containing protein [Tahibacter amnicola]|uniref:ATP-binding cassette domain-containing protein n=1 Tax=Tahibacter amnicola TaxID=2976241 RepID=A0ABY6B9F4_9GAMM|nr:ATP-binding cassette domain-containing protein [Tahibacter amnicola]UXI66187.1 ATP-binding cassette domain-containing protein [Tahibacter amnicola]
MKRAGAVARSCSDAVLHLAHASTTAEGFTLALAGITVSRGERLGVIGRNGCGKTTLLEALVGLREMDRLEGTLLGQPLQAFPRDPALRAQCGVVLQQSELSLYTTVREVLALHQSLYACPWPDLHRRLALDELLSLRARLLSRGQRQRLYLYLALAHRPRLVLLDEPMTGLDRRYVDLVADLLRNSPELADTAFLIVGHTPDELALCDAFVWIHEGRVVDRGNQAMLLDRHLGAYRTRIHSAEAAQIDCLLLELDASGIPLQRVERSHPNHLLLFSSRPLDAEIAQRAPEHGWVSFESGRSQLEDLVRTGPRAAHAAPMRISPGGVTELAEVMP